MTYNVGDWVQAVDEVTEEDFLDEALFVHARPGAVGHVLGGGPEGWANVYWERTGTVTVVDVAQLKLLCSVGHSVRV